MSDMRAIIAIGVSITSLVMVFGIFSLIPNDASTMSTGPVPMAALGHVELKVIGPDGVIKGYVQTDNVSQDNIKECMMNTSFAGGNFGNTNCAEITQMAIGDSGADVNDDTLQSLGREFNATGRAVEGTNATIVMTHNVAFGSIVQANFTARDAVVGSSSFVIAAADTVTGGTCTTDNDFDGLNECQIQEVGLFHTAAGGKMMFRSTFGAVEVEAGDLVEMTYIVTLTG